MKEWLVAAGPASLDVAANLSVLLNSNLAKLETTDFPDGESKIRVEGNFRNKNVIVVQSTYPPIDKHLLQLLLIAHKLSEESE